MNKVTDLHAGSCLDCAKRNKFAKADRSDCEDDQKVCPAWSTWNAATAKCENPSTCSTKNYETEDGKELLACTGDDRSCEAW